MMKGAIYSSNGGWYSTAKVHKKLGVDLSLRINTSFVPSADRSFTITDLEYISTDAESLPTIAGESRQEDLMITICKSLGISTEKSYTAKNGRPMKIANGGKIISELIT